MSLEFVKTYIGNPHDLPEAVGYIRYLQLGSLKILIEFDRVCRQHGLMYSLFAGTLLGAVRHNGYIPWDDDVDVIMPRKDYQRIIEVFNKNTQIPGLKANLYSASNGIWNIIKVKHEAIPSIYIDIFPADFYYKQLSIKESADLAVFVKQLIIQHVKSQSTWPSIEAFHQSFVELAEKNIPELQPVPGIKPMLMLGTEFLHGNIKYWAFDHDLVFPLRQIKFEGWNFFCPQDPDLCLTLHYGDYMRIPAELHMHTQLKEIPMEEIFALKKFIRPHNKRK